MWGVGREGIAEARELMSRDALTSAIVDMWLHGGGAGVCSRPCGTGTILQPWVLCLGTSTCGDPWDAQEVPQPHPTFIPWLTVAVGGEGQLLHSPNVVTMPLVSVWS